MDVVSDLDRKWNICEWFGYFLIIFIAFGHYGCKCHNFTSKWLSLKKHYTSSDIYVETAVC